MINIVLCGGNGTRLWPLSRTMYPKQFNKIFDDVSLFQKTIQRNRGFCNGTVIVSNEEQYFLALDQLEDMKLNDAKFLLEPVGRNTAPAIALACLSIDSDEIVLVTPSDHFIEVSDEYTTVLNRAKELANAGYLVTFGIKPVYPETGFGYIEADEENVLSFKEKPSYELAKEYIEKGNYYWNSGMFVFKASVFLEELEKHSPKIFDKCRTAYINANGLNVLRIDKDDMLNIPVDSIDYAVMEKSNKVKVISSNIIWSDLGSFEALDEQLPKNDEGNTIASNNVYVNSYNNLIISSEKMVAAIDVEGLVIVDTPDALLITKKGSSHKVKDVVISLNNRNSTLTQSHLTVFRPWGNSTILESSDQFKIKKVIVKPGGKLTRQMHYHRNEHWIVVSGTAKVTIGTKEFILKTNESTYIPMGEDHLVENPGKIDLVLIEARVGSYLEEDDDKRRKLSNLWKNTHEETIT